jgi:hypothetical protein
MDSMQWSDIQKSWSFITSSREMSWSLVALLMRVRTCFTLRAGKGVSELVFEFAGLFKWFVGQLLIQLFHAVAISSLPTNVVVKSLADGHLPGFRGNYFFRRILMPINLLQNRSTQVLRRIPASPKYFSKNDGIKQFAVSS